MNNKKNLDAITYILIFIPILLLFPLLWLETQSYDKLIVLIAQSLHRPDLEGLLRNKLFTRERYLLVFTIHWWIYPCILLFVFIGWKYRYRIDALLQSFLKASLFFLKRVRWYWKEMQLREKYWMVGVLLLYVVLSFYKILNRDITYDEAWNYNYFISKPPFFSFILFNTYPFYHFIASVLHYLPIDPCLLARSLCIVAGMAVIVLVFALATKWMHAWVAVLLIGLLMASPMFVVYTALVKGVLVSLFFSLVHFYATTEYARLDADKKYRFLFILSSFLNLITMPTALLFSASTGCFLLLKAWYNKDGAAFKRICVDTSLPIVVSLLFYLPILISSGAGSLLGAESKDSTLGGFQNYFTTTSSFFWGIDWLNYLIIILGVVHLFWSPYNKHRRLVCFNLFLIIMSLLAYLLKPFPDRSLVFLMIPYLFVMGCVFDNVRLLFIYLKQQRIGSIVAITYLILLLVPMFKASYDYANPTIVDKTEPKRVSNFMLEHQVKTCYVQHPDFWINYPEIEYYYLLQHKFWDMHNSQSWSTRYKPFSLLDNYDCIVTDTSKALKTDTNYILRWKEKDIRMYLRKELIPSK